MKKLLGLLCVAVSLNATSQALNRSFENADGSLKLLGKITQERLEDAPFAEWFITNKDAYTVNASQLESVTLPDSITVFMGTWCGDSRREVPRFIKVLESYDYDFSRLKIICLNSGFQNYKQAPEREERGVNIHRVPTFIMHDSEGNETGRIVEEPVVSLESDLAAILSGEKYETAYPIAEKMVEYLQNYSLKELKKRRSKLLSEFSSAENPYELNTYGYVLWSSFQLPEAQFVLELNADLFPEETVTHRTLASFLNGLGHDKEALSSIEKGLKIEPENQRLLSLENAIKEQTK